MDAPSDRMTGQVVVFNLRMLTGEFIFIRQENPVFDCFLCIHKVRPENQQYKKKDCTYSPLSG